MSKAFQDYYKEKFCYGCGSKNDKGLKIKSYWEGEKTICYFKPKSYHSAYPGIVYGGLIASVIDCHGIGSATAAAYKSENREIGTDPEIKFVTGLLKVKYIKPIPINETMTLYGYIKEIKEKKIIVEIEVLIKNNLCAIGKVTAVRILKKN